MSIRLVLGILLFVLLAAAFGLLAHEVVVEKEDWFDTKIFAFFQSIRSPDMISLFERITFLGSTAFLLPAYLLVILYLIILKRKDDAINTALLGVSSTLLMYILKVIFARERPDFQLPKDFTDYSFPSGHTSSSFVFCGILVWLLWKSSVQIGWKITGAIILVLISITVAASRIVLRHHYASDVFAGFCLAIAWVVLYFFIAGRINKPTSPSTPVS